MRDCHGHLLCKTRSPPFSSCSSLSLGSCSTRYRNNVVFLTCRRVYIPSPPNQVSILPPTRRCLNRALTAMPSLALGAPHHTPCTFRSGGFEKDTVTVRFVLEQRHQSCWFFSPSLKSFSPTMWNQNCLQNFFFFVVTHLCELTE